MLIRVVTTVLVLLAGSACAGRSDVDVEIDDSVRFGDFETSFSYSDDGSSRVRIKAFQTSGELSQSLQPSERIRFDGAVISGPAEVTGEIDLAHVSLAAGSYDYSFGPSYPDTRTIWFWGLSYTEFDLSLNNSGRQLGKSDGVLELYLEFGSVQHINEAWRLGATVALGIEDFLSLTSQFEVRVEYLLHEHFRINGGIRLFSYGYDSDGDDADIEVDFSGPFLGVNVPL